MDADKKKLTKQCVNSIKQICPDSSSNHWKNLPEINEKTTLMQKLSDIYHQDNTTDVCIKIDDKIYNCHMLILQSYSKFFQSHSKHEQFIQLDMNPEIFCTIYKWMLSDTKQIYRKGFVQLLIGAQYLQVDMLEQQCWNLIQDGSKFQEAEAFMLYLEARSPKCQKIQSMMLQRVQKFFLTVVCCKEFVQMEPDEIKSWLKLDSIAVNLEVEIFYSVARWVLYDWNARKMLLNDLMTLVRFGLMEPWRIVEFRSNKKTGKLKAILESNELQNMLESGMSYAIYRNSYEDSSEQFADFLARFNYKRLNMRDLLTDIYWQQTYGKSQYTFEQFEEYLCKIRSNATNYWTNLSV